MAKRHNLAIAISIMVTLFITGVIVADFFYKFGNGDLPFLLVFVPYTVLCVIQRKSSRLTFEIVLLLVLFMAYSYIVNGEFRLTERIGEWFYLFLVFGLVQYMREALPGRENER